jgi:hypothetical protein
MVAFIAVRHLHPGGILFYQGVALGGLVAMLQFAVARRSRAEEWLASSKDALLTFLLIYAFVFTVPTTVDRSYTVKMIHHLAEARDGLSREDVDRLFVADFVERGGVDRRLLEQSVTGTIEERDGRYQLTTEGRILGRVFRGMEIMFACGS